MTGTPATTIGYHCSHELHQPSELLRNVKLAEKLGFGAAMCSDHIHPWLTTQKGNGFAWSWLGSALEATSLSLGTVCAPGYRYHPAIIGQAAATLAEMYPERFWVSLGSGEALNEHITGEPWPPKPERNQRLKECAEVMRALWAGENVNHDGQVRVVDARLQQPVAKPPLIVAACLSEETARWAGGWADAMVTVSKPPEDLRKMVDAFREGGGEGKPMFLQVVLSYAQSDEEALHAAFHLWRQAALEPRLLAELATPEDFDAAVAKLQPEDVRRAVRVSPSRKQHLEWLMQDKECGFERLYLHNIHPDQARFMQDFAESVLPAFTV